MKAWDEVYFDFLFIIKVGIIFYCMQCEEENGDVLLACKESVCEIVLYNGQQKIVYSRIMKYAAPHQHW